MNKKKEICSNNPAIGDPGSIDTNIEQKRKKLNELQQELHKYQVCYGSNNVAILYR